MASTFPGAIDSFVDPLSGSALNSPSHSAQHADLNDAAEKIEAFMGLVKVTSASFSAVTSISITAGTFTTLYKNYRVILDLTASSGVTNITTRFRASSVDNSSNVYRQTTLGLLSTGTAANFTGDRTDFALGSMTNASGGFLYSVFDVNNMATSGIKTIMGQTTFNNGTNHSGAYTQGQLNTSYVFDSMSFIASGGFNITGTYYVYGYRN
jgi:hypothetical protein